MNRYLLTGLLAVAGTLPLMAGAAVKGGLHAPAPGVVCDTLVCADATGISDSLTTKYLGAKRGKQLAAQGEFDRTAFAFANGVYCDTKEKVCRKDRYFGADGKPSGAIDRTTTQRLFTR